jgi:hypothetical protein
MIFRTLSVMVVLIIGTFIVIRRIIKLPSKYERKPKKLSTWVALDKGIDPTENDEMTQ